MFEKIINCKNCKYFYNSKRCKEGCGICYHPKACSYEDDAYLVVSEKDYCSYGFHIPNFKKIWEEKPYFEAFTVEKIKVTDFEDKGVKYIRPWIGVSKFTDTGKYKIHLAMLNNRNKIEPKYGETEIIINPQNNIEISFYGEEIKKITINDEDYYIYICDKIREANMFPSNFETNKTSYYLDCLIDTLYYEKV